MELLKRIWNWLKEPRRTPGEQWAIENGVHEAWQKGYSDRFACGELQSPFKAGDPRNVAYHLGFDDAQFDLDRQW